MKIGYEQLSKGEHYVETKIDIYKETKLSTEFLNGE